MAQYSPGELDSFFYVPEVTYGTTPPVGDVATLTWGCDIISCKGRVNFNKEFHTLSSTERTYGAVTKGAYDVGFNLKGIAHATSGAYDWRNLWAVYGFGSTTGLTAHPGSFTAQVSKTVSATYDYDFYNGCKINTLKISSEGPGKVLTFEADVLARWLTQDTDKSITGLQALTVGADPSEITTAVLTWAGVSQINIAAGGLANWYPRKWELTVNNKLERHYANIVGADTNKYPVTYAMGDGLRDIIFTCELPYEGETYTAAKLASSAITAITLPIDTHTLTLSNGELMMEDDDWPEYKHDLMDEPVRVKFKSLSIA